MPPQLGHGPDLFPDSVTFDAFSKKKPDGNAVPQVSQKAGIDGMDASYDAQHNLDCTTLPHTWRLTQHDK
jgi:hypothetical protein